MVYMFFCRLDPRLKVFGDRKISELRAWFDSRLEDAIQAAEEEGKVAAQGKISILFFASYSPFCALAFPCQRFGFLFCVLSMFVVIIYRNQQWTEIVLSCRR